MGDVSRWRKRRFNDAAPNRAEERTEGAVTLALMPLASMMPPPIGRKNSRSCVRPACGLLCFNDAAPNRAEERGDAGASIVQRVQASMMPPPIGRKNPKFGAHH